MHFEKTIEKDIAVLTVNLKRATMNEAAEFKSMLAGEIESGRNNIVVDMSDCEFIDSTFLGVLVTSLKKLNGIGEILLVGFRNTARSIIDITGTSKIFRIYSSVKEAISSFKPAA